jgi:hypothetical protein
MSEHFFGSGNGRVSDRLARRVDKIAREYGATFTAVTLPGDGPRYWFSCRNRGNPFDQETARDTLKAVERAGISLPGRKHSGNKKRSSRKSRGSRRSSRKSRAARHGNAGPQSLHDRPLASPPLKSYRYRGNHGWIMIGATDDADALREAKRSLSSGTEVRPERLEAWNGQRYVAVRWSQDTRSREPTESEVGLLRRLAGFRYPRATFAGRKNDLRDIDHLVKLGLLIEHGDGAKRYYTVPRSANKYVGSL